MRKQLQCQSALMTMAFSVLALQPAFCQDTTTPPGSQPAASTTSPAKPPLEGGVQKVHVSLADLRTVGLDLKNVLKAASSLYDEVTIQPVEIVTEPEVIGMGTVINIPISTRTVGPPAPARKDRVDLAMSHMKPTIEMLKANVEQFVTGHKQLDWPTNVIAILQPQLDDWAKTVETLSAQQTQLEKLTVGPPYNQPEIAQECMAVEKSIKDLEKTRNQVYKVLHKHAKELNTTSRLECEDDVAMDVSQ